MSEASDFLEEYALFIPESHKAPHTKIGPCGVIESMSLEKREVLKSLKSEDLSNIKPDVCRKFFKQGKGRWGTRF